MADQPVKGLDETLAVLSAFPANLQRNAITRGMRAAGNVVRDEARLRAPKDTGKLAKAIKTGSPRKLENGVHSVRVRLDGEHSYLGIFHEYGVAAHYIARTGKGEGRVALRRSQEGGKPVNARVMKIGGDFVTGAVLHPGFAAHPFMRPALDIKADEAVEALAEAVKDFVEQKVGFRA